ncbi:transglutaminase family protein [Ruficoccus amylovorans]|uniref:Transglutaminase family protein n=1 Tax=Ruficoccus amylovorans TaxID=1804625 RepID=A0A842HF07_9BACT|nr:transglutaminase family protein [Ruficoccus amylovorans]MBC2594810.1 transglutaminase family protein [Ruficoccus amylovorans]
MRFKVTHTTRYRYKTPASESYAELRVWPQNGPTQKILSHKLEITPNVPVDHYTDYFGNKVEYFSIPFRHNELSVNAVGEVETREGPDLSRVLETPIGDARQILASQPIGIFDFIQNTELVSFYRIKDKVDRPNFRDAESIGEAVHGLNTWIYENFAYSPGSTDIGTPLPTVLETRQGVCQDFAHLMLAILRMQGIPARYVSGYIEPYDPTQPGAEMTGAAASHAWVEVYLPGGHWYGLDPTNNQAAGLRHVRVACGRDYNDVAPMRGAYKGAQDQRLQVIVTLKRRRPKKLAEAKG